MKKLILLFVLVIGLQMNAQYQSHDNWFFNVGFNQDQDMSLYSFVDPTFKSAGYQIGIGFRKNVSWFTYGLEFSVYEELSPTYVDGVVMVGTTYNINRVDITGLFRAGLVNRAEDNYPLAGLQLSISYHVTNKLAVGFRLWADYRTDQADNAYGDSDAYEPGLIFTNPLSQENGAIEIIWTIN